MWRTVLVLGLRASLASSASSVAHSSAATLDPHTERQSGHLVGAHCSIPFFHVRVRGVHPCGVSGSSLSARTSVGRHRAYARMVTVTPMLMPAGTARVSCYD